MTDALLDSILFEAVKSVDNDSNTKNDKNVLLEVNIFNQESNQVDKNQAGASSQSKKTSSLIHSGDTDSSDDEDNKYFEQQNYNESGKEIKQLLHEKPSTPINSQQEQSWNQKSKRQELIAKAKTAISKQQDVGTDPVFGLRIINPLVSFSLLRERMIGRESVSFLNLQKFLSKNVSDVNWVLAGVIIRKSSVKTSQKGHQFLIWTLSDLKGDIKTATMFLFRGAYKEYWKTTVGTVVGILNPSMIDKNDKFKDEVSLSVDNAQKIMILGQSKDFGFCKSKKKNEDPCTAVVNISRCEYCVYHIKQEYKKCSNMRPDLQANFSGKGFTALKKQFLARNGLPAIAAKVSSKLKARDQGLLQALDGKPMIKSNGAIKKNVGVKAATNLDISFKQRMKDLALLEKLGGGSSKTDFNAAHSSEVTLESSKNTAINVIAKLKASSNAEIAPKAEPLKSNILVNASMSIPKLSCTSRGMVDLEAPTTRVQISRAKLNAIKYIQKNGSLAKVDPNQVKSPHSSKKRSLNVLNEEENTPKKQKIEDNEFLSDRFKKMMETNSKHMDLLENRDLEERDKYFYKLEAKERMEDKMMSTYKVLCKAVRCLKCKYTNFSASQSCKDEKHPLRVFDAMKRFFKCGNCQNRTVSLEIVPIHACKNCGGSKWERTGMMKEKIVVPTPNLSIRGGEQTFVNSTISNGNLNLLVPDEQ